MKTELLKLKPNVEALTTKDLRNVFGGGPAGPAGPVSDKGDASHSGISGSGGACCCACR